MYSNEERIVKNEKSSLIDDVTGELSLAEQVFTKLQIYSETSVRSFLAVEKRSQRS